MRILIADDHHLIRQGLELLIEGFAECEVVGSTGDGLEATRLVLQLLPDVVILDINMPGMNGIEACRCMLSAQPKLGVILLSMHPDESYVLRGIEAGARGYVLKDAAPEELEQALRLVARGESYFSPQVTGAVMARLLGPEKAPVPALSARQLQVLRLICDGHSNPVIAKRLGISPKTVDTHRSQLMQKLGVHDVANLTRYAIRVGLIS